MKLQESYSLEWYIQICICCNSWFSEFTPLKDEIYPQVLIYPRLRTTGLDVNDTCKRPISSQKHLHLICQAKLFRDPNITFRDPKWGRDP